MRPMRNAIAGTLVLALLLAAQVPADELSAVKLRSRTFTPQAGLASLDVAHSGPSESMHVFVQLSEPFSPQLRRELSNLDVRLIRYIPDDTWIAGVGRNVMIDPDVRSRLAWVGEILPRDKMPARLWEGWPGAWASRPDGRLELRVRLHDDIDPQTFLPSLEALGAEVLERMAIFPGFTILADQTLILTLAEMDETMWITEGLPPRILDNDQVRTTTGAESIQEPPYDLSGQGVRVGIWDGGRVDPNHDDFDGRLTIGESASTSDHATHVAGTVGCSGILSQSNGGEPLQWRGMAPQVELFSYDYYGSIINEIVGGIQMFDFDIETNSWSFGVDASNCEIYGDYDFLAPEFDAIVTGYAGKKLSVTFSAGNERNDGDCPLPEGQYACMPPPKGAKNIIAVGASNSDDDSMTDFSSWGPVDDGRIRPDVVAPGCERTGEAHVHSTLPPDTYGGPGWCGTSMSTPAVAGHLALLYELYARENEGADPEPSLMKGLLVTTAVDRGNPGPDYSWGHGRVDVKAAADALLYDTQYVASVDHGEVLEFPFAVPEGAPWLRAALVWDDPDAAPQSNPALINNLDLVLIDPNQEMHRPWILDPASPSADATRGVDNLNNVEHITVDGPAEGRWIARVEGTNVPEGPQIASLVGLDSKRPEAPGDFEASNITATTVDLTWTNAPDVDRKGTLIVRLKGVASWIGPTAGQSFIEGTFIQPGIFVVYVRDEDHSSDPLTDTGLFPGESYAYRAYTFDDMHNYSIAAMVLVTTETSSVEPVSGAASPLTLHLARPNPAGGRMEIVFSLPEASFVRLRLFEPSGRLVRTLANGDMAAGTYRVVWNGRDDSGRRVATGAYFYELRAGSERITRQLMWVR